MKQKTEGSRQKMGDIKPALKGRNDGNPQASNHMISRLDNPGHGLVFAKRIGTSA
jgi:hypothetical protein